MFKSTADSEYLCACFDFHKSGISGMVRENVMKKIVSMGVSVIKTDFSEAVPEGCCVLQWNERMTKDIIC